MSSKYPVQYQSSSKGAVDIEGMATPHLMNAWRKLGADADTPLMHCMNAELVSRGGTLNPETQRWEFPAKEEAKP
jgi:hypothetical protein